jgi:hypothetical protein
MTTFNLRSSCSTINDDDDPICPTCQMCYDSAGRRKLVDTSCGHSRCFKCMFKINQCPLCLNGIDGGDSPQRKLTLPGRKNNFGNNQNKTQSLSGGSVKIRPSRLDNQRDLCAPTAFLPDSLHSRESGFQSFASSMSSVCSRIQLVSLNNGGGHHQQQNGDQDNNDDDSISVVSAFDRRSVTSGGSFISLMSCQSNLPFHSADPASGMNRNDFKRHSLSSFKRIRSDCGNNGISSRNSVTRRSAIVTRSSRMSSIEENRRKFT